LMKSSPASISVLTSSAVRAGDKPTLGLMIVPMTGRPSTSARLNFPS
jgi:hypothetical protein